jgi:hypothetical protein
MRRDSGGDSDGILIEIETEARAEAEAEAGVGVGGTPNHGFGREPDPWERI